MDSKDYSADPLYCVASEIENQATKLTTCIGMLRDAANFTCNDVEQVKQVQARILYLVDSLEPICRDLGNAAEAAYEGAGIECSKKIAASLPQNLN